MTHLLLSMLVSVLALGAVPAFAAPVAISACGQGQTITGHAVLTADLDCTGTPSHAVEIIGKLDLNGHTIKASSQRLAVHCLGNCSVIGPGTITSDDGLGVLGRRNLIVKNVTFHGVHTAITAVDTVGKGRAVIQGCTITDVDTGILAAVPVRMADTIVSGARQSGIALGKRDGTECAAVRATVKRSSISGSGTDPRCGVDTTDLGYTGFNCADVLACAKPPRLVHSTCATSCSNARAPTCAPWGICSAD
jgi:hypothetical protein